MRKTRMWLMSLPLLALCSPLTAIAEEPAKPVSATVETGGAGLAVKDDIKRVNEFSSIRTKPGINPYGKVDLNIKDEGIELDINSRYMDSRDQTHGASLDVKRFLKSDFSYDAFQHWLDHDKINYLDAGVVAPPAAFTGATVVAPFVLTNSGTLAPQTINIYDANLNRLSNNFTPAFVVFDGSNNVVGVTNSGPRPGDSGVPAGYRFQQIGRASVFGEELDAWKNTDFQIVRREWKSKTDLTIPQLPNLTFHFGYRQEERKGVEQSISMGKCTSCHIVGKGKDVDEKTRDLTAGVTGKFGLVTMNYSFLKRQFRENAEAPRTLYDPAISPAANFPADYLTGPQVFDNRMLYDYRNGLIKYDVTPDSNKDSHVVKAKVDLPSNTSVMASYVRANVDSDKQNDIDPTTNTIMRLGKDNLETKYDSYGLKVSTRLGKNLTVSVRGKIEKLENDDVQLYFDTLPIVALPATGYRSPTGAGATPPNQFTPTAASQSPVRQSIMNRDVFTTGIDAVYRIAKRTTLRLGYEFQENKRDDHEVGETKTHTVKAVVNTRASSTISARANYVYKNIDNQFHNPNAAMVPATGYSFALLPGMEALPTITGPFGTTVGAGPTYGVSFYDRRTANLSNLPEDVHEGLLSSTWSPSARFSTTAFYRVKLEKNELNKSEWKQDTHSPGVSMWYAPTDKLNFTLAYNYLKQNTQTSFCQGWYDG